MQYKKEELEILDKNTVSNLIQKKINTKRIASLEIKGTTATKTKENKNKNKHENDKPRPFLQMVQTTPGDTRTHNNRMHYDNIHRHRP